MILVMTHKKTTSNHITINMGKNVRKQQITPLSTLYLDVILHYITLTGYDISNDT